MDDERTVTYGEKAVGISFNPSGNSDVEGLKNTCATFINHCHSLRQDTEDPEVKRMLSIAITEAQTAQMWAVKAVTWKSN